MPSRPSSDTNQTAHAVVKTLTDKYDPPDPEQMARSNAAKLLGALGASKGGKARAKALTKAERVAIARKGATAKWKKAAAKK